MADKIRWGLLSTANINKALIDPLKQASRSELVAVASRNPDQAQAYAQEHQIPKAYGGYESMLADPDIDAVYNTMPNTLHAEWTIKAAEAGKHVLCEKPIVPTLAELDAVEAAVSAHNVTVFEAFMYLHHPQTRHVKAMITDGKLGELQVIQSWFNFYLPPERSNNIRLNPTLAGGATWDVGVYPNSLAITMAGSAPISVYATMITGETGVDVSMAGQLTFADSVTAQISCGFRSAFRAGAHIVGSEGTVFIPDPWKPGSDGQDSHIVFTTKDGTSETLTFAATNPYLAEVEAMEACLLDGAAPVVPLSQSRVFLQSILALYQSAESGQPVML